jgi:uncharacterized protein YjgD (DUF1641 family)
MANEITVTGDTVFYNGQAIATLHEKLGTTQRVEFVDAIVGIRSEDEIADEINKAETEARKSAVENFITELRDSLEIMEDVSRVETLVDRLEKESVDL